MKFLFSFCFLFLINFNLTADIVIKDSIIFNKPFYAKKLEYTISKDCVIIIDNVVSTIEDYHKLEKGNVIFTVDDDKPYIIIKIVVNTK